MQVNSTPVKSAPATSVSTKKSTVKQKAGTPNQTKHGSVTVPVAAKPDDTSESSDSSDSGNEEPPSVTQVHLSDTVLACLSKAGNCHGWICLSAINYNKWHMIWQTVVQLSFLPVERSPTYVGRGDW